MSELHSKCLSLLISVFIFKAGLSLTWNPPFQLGWLAREPQDPLVSTWPSPSILHWGHKHMTYPVGFYVDVEDQLLVSEQQALYLLSHLLRSTYKTTAVSLH